MKKTKRTKFLVLIIIILFIIIFLSYQNNRLVVSSYNYENDKIPDSFVGTKIVHISDLHNKMFGKNQKKLVELIKKHNPDIIVITGDIVDRRRYNLDNALILIGEIKEIAEIYYVSGNHEVWSNKYEDIKKGLINLGVNVLDNDVIKLEKNDEIIEIVGLSDPSLINDNFSKKFYLDEILSSLKSNNFQILLSHRPEYFDLYCNHEYELIFSGHAHGGQIRLPFIGGLVAPDQGLFPKYTAGYYTNNLSTMFVSRGLGNSIFPFRVFNQPELIVINLQKK